MPKQGWLSKNQQRTVDNIRNTQNQLIKQGRMEPVPITNLAASSNLKTRGAQVGFLVTSLQGIDQIVLLRGYSRDLGSAQQLHVWSAAALKQTPQTYPIRLQHTDADPANSGQKCYYWIKVVPHSNATTPNTFLSGPQLLDASNLPVAAAISGDTALYQAYTPTTQPLTATTGGPVNHATVSIASFQIQYPFDANGDGNPDLVTYSSGSITPLLDSTTYYVFFDDPTYVGGAQNYQATTDQTQIVAGLHRQYIGSITTPVHGGGGTGGGGGGNGPCFSGNTKIVTKRGLVPIEEVRVGDHIYSKGGWRVVQAITVHDFDGIMQEMGSGELVTPSHRIWKPIRKRGYRGDWVQAQELFTEAVPFKGKVFNLVLLKSAKANDDHYCYLLANGYHAHNVRKA